VARREHAAVERHVVAASTIVIVAYDASWPRTFQREQRRIQAALGERLIAIEHIGSTSVPGLAAKPIVDIMAGIGRIEDAAACIAPLEAIGYRFRPEITTRLGMLDDRLFVKSSGGTATVNLHVTEYGGGFWREKLLFRDFLRGHPETARAYEALKRELAPRFSEGPRYSTAKTDFIQSVLQRARREGG
jgi:GrpB-like predicted nucleotidyltransferase (UPF0157 family)